jgi:hypothetical protein
MSNEVELVKKGHTKDSYTKEQLAQLMRSMDDPVYFTESFVKIQHPTKGSINFQLFDYQREMIRAFLLWLAMFRPDTQILIAANKFSQAMEIMDRIRYSYEECPNFIRAGVVEYNKGTITFDNGSRITARATTPDAGRGLSITCLYLDEFAFVRPTIAKEFWTAIQPTLSTGGSCIVTSTPKSDEDQFAQIWKGANDNTDDFGNAIEGGIGRNGFKPILVKWDAHPDRDEKWADTFRATLGEAKFRQEMECEFVSDDETLINPLTLSTLRSMEPEFYTGKVRWFKEPEPNKAYLVALDPCLGTGGDFAALQVFQYPEMIQVAEWMHNQTPARGQVMILMQTLIILHQTLREDPNQDGDPQLFWTVENNTIGETILNVIDDTGEQNFPGIFVSEPRKAGASRRFRKGLNTDNRKKLAACGKFKSLVESRRMTIHSKELIKQLKMYVSSGAGYAAKLGEKDDLVASTLLVVRMIETAMQWAIGIDNEDLKEAIDPDDAMHDPMPVIIN